MPHRPILVLCLALALPSPAPALDRGHYRGLEDRDLDHVLAAFQAVSAHYLVTGAGDSIVTVPTGRDPKISAPVKHAVYLYFNPRDAEAARADYNRSHAVKAVVRSAPAANIIRAQFARRGAEAPGEREPPDFVIFPSLQRRIDVIEYLARPGGIPVAEKRPAGSEIVPAFLDREKAIRRQADLAGRGIKTDRIGLDERAFIQFVVSMGRKGRPVLVEGF